MDPSQKVTSLLRWAAVLPAGRVAGEAGQV
jgi:hypothetical protein